MKIIVLYFLLLSSLAVGAQDETFVSLSNKANNLIEEQKYEEALVCFEKAIEMGTDNQEMLAWTSMTAGICAQQINELSKAFQHFETAIINKCKDEDIYERYFNLAASLEDGDKQERALQVGRNYIDGGYEKYTVCLMNYYYRTKQYEKTIQIADTLINIGNRQVQFYNIKGASLQNLKKVEESIPVYKEALKISSNNFNSLRQLGLIYYDKAANLYNNTMNSYKSISDPSGSEYKAARDNVNLSISYYKQAASYLEQAVQIQPTDEIVKDYLEKAKKKSR